MLTILRCQGCWNKMKDFTMIGMLKVTGVNFLEILKCPAEWPSCWFGTKYLWHSTHKFHELQASPLSHCPFVVWPHCEITWNDSTELSQIEQQWRVTCFWQSSSKPGPGEELSCRPCDRGRTGSDVCRLPGPGSLIFLRCHICCHIGSDPHLMSHEDHSHQPRPSLGRLNINIYTWLDKVMEVSPTFTFIQFPFYLIHSIWQMEESLKV